MDEQHYHELVDVAFARIERGLEALDPDDVEVDTGGGYLTLTLRGGETCVISTQRPVCEIWMAAERSAWHFAYDEAAQRWVAKKSGEELFSTLRAILARRIGVPIAF